MVKGVCFEKGGCVWQVVMCGEMGVCLVGGHVWQGMYMAWACMAGGPTRWGCAWWGGMHGGACMAGGVHGRRDDHYSGWYTSYWNEFLFYMCSSFSQMQPPASLQSQLSYHCVWMCISLLCLQNEWNHFRKTNREMRQGFFLGGGSRVINNIHIIASGIVRKLPTKWVLGSGKRDNR